MSLKKFQRIQADLKKKLSQTDQQLTTILNENQRENHCDLIELQIERLKLIDKLRYLRPMNPEDTDYRKNIFENFAYWSEDNIPENLRLVFHASTLANSERILNSGKIISGKDNWTIRTSGNNSGEISVSTKSNLFISLAGHMDLTAQEYYLPCGCLFVLQPDNQTYQIAKQKRQIPNVFLRKNPQQLYAIITTPENQNRVKWWLQKNNFSPDKCYTFESFKEKITSDKLFFSAMNYSAQKQQI